MNRWQKSALVLTSMIWCQPLAGCTSDAPQHWTELEQCLIGAPLEQDENVFARLRGVQLAESLAATGSAQDWPGRCADYASKLHASLPDDGKPGMIKRALAEQLGCDGGCVFPKGGHPLPAADKLWEAVARAELERQQVSSAAPLAPRKSLSEADWTQLSGGQLIDHRWSGPGELWLLLKDEKGLSWCSLRAKKARCAAVEGAPKFNPNAPVAFASDSRNPVIAGAVFSEQAGLVRTGYSPGAKEQVELFGEVGHEAYHGVGFAQKQREPAEPPGVDAKPIEPQFEVRRMQEGKSIATAVLKLTAQVRGPEVVEDWLVYVERDEDQKTVFKAKLLEEGSRLFAQEGVAYQADFPGPFQVCSASPGAAIGSYVPPVRLLGKPASGNAPLTVSLLEGKVWHPPVQAQFPKQVGLFSNWRCGPGWGGFSWLEQVGQKLVVTELLCKKAGCKKQQVSFTQPDLKNALLLGHVHDKMLLVYQSVADDVRARVGSVSEFAKAQSTLAFESPDFGGVEMGQPLLLEGDQAYLLLQKGGLRALAIDGAGGVQAVTR